MRKFEALSLRHACCSFEKHRSEGEGGGGYKKLLRVEICVSISFLDFHLESSS